MPIGMAKMTKSDVMVAQLERRLWVSSQSCSEVKTGRIQSREWTCPCPEEPAPAALATHCGVQQPHHPQCGAGQGQAALNLARSQYPWSASLDNSGQAVSKINLFQNSQPGNLVQDSMGVTAFLLVVSIFFYATVVPPFICTDSTEPYIHSRVYFLYTHTYGKV